MLAAGLVKSSVEALASGAGRKQTNLHTKAYGIQKQNVNVCTTVQLDQKKGPVPGHLPSFSSFSKLQQMMAVHVHSHCLHTAYGAPGFRGGLGSPDDLRCRIGRWPRPVLNGRPNRPRHLTTTKDLDMDGHLENGQQSPGQKIKASAKGKACDDFFHQGLQVRSRNLHIQKWSSV